MRCPDCNKFVSFDSDVEPEVNDLEVNEDGFVSCNVRIVNACGDCGTELKEASFDMESEIEIGEHKGEEHELTVENTGAERTSRSGFFQKGKFVSGFGRYAKTFYGAAVDFTVTCSCGKLDVSGQMTEEVQASGMDELV